MSSAEDARRLNKRPRPVVSCLECRNRKLKCNRCLPCDRCLKDGRENLCKYATGQKPLSNTDLDSQTVKRSRLSTESSLDSATAELLVKFNELQNRVQQLEGTLPAQPSHGRAAIQPLPPSRSDHVITQTHEESDIDQVYNRKQNQLYGRNTLLQVSTCSNPLLSI